MIFTFTPNQCDRRICAVVRQLLELGFKCLPRILYIKYDSRKVENWGKSSMIKNGHPFTEKSQSQQVNTLMMIEEWMTRMTRVASIIGLSTGLLLDTWVRPALLGTDNPGPFQRGENCLLRSGTSETERFVYCVTSTKLLWSIRLSDMFCTVYKLLVFNV